LFAEDGCFVLVKEVVVGLTDNFCGGTVDELAEGIIDDGESEVCVFDENGVWNVVDNEVANSNLKCNS
jgi:hypothetical protein